MRRWKAQWGVRVDAQQGCAQCHSIDAHAACGPLGGDDERRQQQQRHLSPALTGARTQTHMQGCKHTHTPTPHSTHVLLQHTICSHDRRHRTAKQT